MLSAAEEKEFFITRENESQNVSRKKETKVQYLWRILRLTLRDTVKAVIATERSAQKVVHGISHIRSISPNLAPNVGNIFDVALNPAQREAVLIDANCAYITNWFGRLNKVIVFDRPNIFQRILYCLSSQQYVAWKPGEDSLTLLDRNVHVVNTTIADIPIYAAIYNVYRSEIVLGHIGGTSAWQFRYNNQYLVQNRHANFRSFPSEKFEFVSLEATSSKSQRGFAASRHLVVVFSLESGQVLDYKKNLHLTDMTAILYFNPLKLLITAAKDGTIKAWNPDWTIKRVLVGHTGPINSLSFYPFGASFVSCGSDRTMRLWCLDTPGQLSSVTVENPLLSCTTVRDEECFMSVSSSGQVDAWKAHDLHVLHTCGGSGYVKLLCTTRSFWPLRVIAMCGDGCVRLISTTDGTILSTALPPLLLQHGTSRKVSELVDISYTAFDDSLFAVYDNGDLIKFCTNTNPATLVYTAEAESPFQNINALVMYEKICNPWPQPKEKSLATDNLSVVGHLSLKVSQRLNRCILFAGRKDGRIVVIDWKTGVPQFEVDGHLSDGGVCCLAITEKTDILVTSGHDQIIRIWKIYPFNVDPLSLISSFFCAQLPKPLCTMSSNFSAALQHLPSATFALVTYDFDVNDRADHSPLDDHTDEIVAITYCRKLGLMATAATDGTVRIWDDFNKLIRILELNGLAHSVAFCGQNGDLLVGLGDNLHFISHKSYLPMPYLVKLMTLRIRPSPPDQPIPLDETFTSNLSKKAVKLLTAASPASRYIRFDDQVPEDEQRMLDFERAERDKAYLMLANQDAEIIRIGKGVEEPKKPPVKMTPAEKKSAFDRYLDHFYYRPDTKAVDLNAPESGSTPRSPPSEENALEAKVPRYFPTPEPSTFFAKRRLACRKPNWIIDPQAYIPNSVLAKLLFPPPPPDAVEEEWRPPGLTEEQWAQIRAHNNKKFSAKNRVDEEQTFDYEDEEEDSSYKLALLDVVNAEAPRTPTPPPPAPTEEKKVETTARQSEYLSRKLQPQRQVKNDDWLFSAPTSAFDPKFVLPKYTPKKSKKRGKGGLVSSQDALSDDQGQDSQAKGDIQSKLDPSKSVTPKQFVRIVEPPREPTPIRIATPPPPPPPPVQLEEPEIPLPPYILQFIGQPWFDNYFPNPTPKTFPLKPPYSVIAFTDHMMKLLSQTQWNFASAILDSFLVLFREFGTEACDPETVRHTLLRMFDSEQRAVDLNEKEHRQFIYGSANVLVSLNLLDTQVAIELMAFYMVGDDFTRELMLQEFCMGGVIDPKNYFGAEMDSWDPAGGKMDELNAVMQLRRRREFRKIASEWIKRWTARFRRHLERAVARLVQGQALIAAGKRPQAARSNRRSTTLPSISSRLSGDTQLQRTIDTMQVAIRAAPDVAKMPITAVETINYFCDEMAERDAAAAAAAAAGDRNAVIAPVLPEAKLTEKTIRLPRIGAFNYHDCNPERESLCYPDSQFAARQLKRGAGGPTEEDWDPLRFTATHLRLPTAVVNIDGPNNVDLSPMPASAKSMRIHPQDKVAALMEQNRSSFILLTLRSAPKYFYMPPPNAFEEGIELV